MVVNIPMLRGRIIENGYNVQSFAERIGIDRSTFYRRIKDDGLSFTVSEIHAMIDALHLTEEEAARVFLFKNSQKREN